MMRSRLITVLSFASLILLSTQASSAREFKVRATANLAASSRWVAFAEGGWVRTERGKLGFYSSNGVRHRSFDLRGKEVLVAPQGARAVGVIAYADRQPKTLRAVTFDLYGPTGKRILRLTDPPFATAIVAEAGNAFVGLEGAEGLPRSVLRFYDLSGKEKKSLEVERFEGGRYCEDGSVFLFETAAEGLQVYSATGEMLGVIGRADRWAASADATIIAKTTGSRMLFYRDGKLFQTLAWDERHGTIRAMALSPNGGHAAVISATHASVIDVASGATLWTHETGKTPWNYRSAALTDDAGLVSLGSDYDPGADAADRHQRSRCEVFDRDAKLIHTEEGKPTKWGALFPLVRFDPSADRLMFVDRDRFTLLSFE
jgi:hypothetical protein